MSGDRAPPAPMAPGYGQPPPPPTNGHVEDSFATPPAKRQRVSQACGTCRDRKTRCDGRQPVCTPCEGRGVASGCRYDQVRRQRSSRPSYPGQETISESQQQYRAEPVARLNDAAQALSDLGRSVQQPADGTLSATPSQQQNSVNASDAASFRSGSLPKTEWNPAARADGLATIAASQDESLYGPSSTVAFLRHVMPNPSGSTTPSASTSDVKSANVAVPERISQRSGGLPLLPQRRQADNFVTCFWEFIHPLFPVLHKPTFTRKYDHLWVGDHDPFPEHDSEAEEAIFNSILNLVFALGCRFSSLVDPAQRMAVADEFYQRSRQSYPFDILDSTSISLVQMLILTAVFLQSTQHASRCWNSLGLAVRVAQSLGLHVDYGNRKGISQLELQMRRRIWHTSIHLDRLLSMTFGRPSMIDNTVDVPIPDLIDDEHLREAGLGEQPFGTVSRLGLFVSSCKLFELLEEILTMFYRDSSGVSSQRQANGTRATEILTPVLDLNRRLDRFVDSVPDFLRPGNPDTPSQPTHDHLNLQKQVLYSRFLYIRLLSLRPLLLLATRREATYSSSTLDDEVIGSCCRLCTTTACRLIDTLYDNLGTLYRSSGWHTVYFTFASAIVLLASSKLDEIYIQPRGGDVEASWTRCFGILTHYENQIQSAGQAASILRTMRARIVDVARANGPVAPLSEVPGVKAVNHDNVDPALNGQAYMPLNLEGFDFYTADNMASAWYGQQLINLDWLDIPPVQ